MRYNNRGGVIMAKKSIEVRNKDKLREALKSEEDPEVKRKLSLISLVASGMSR